MGSRESGQNEARFGDEHHGLMLSRSGGPQAPSQSTYPKRMARLWGLSSGPDLTQMPRPVASAPSAAESGLLFLCGRSGVHTSLFARPIATVLCMRVSFSGRLYVRVPLYALVPDQIPHVLIWWACVSACVPHHAGGCFTTLLSSLRAGATSPWLRVRVCPCNVSLLLRMLARILYSLVHTRESRVALLEWSSPTVVSQPR